MLTQAWLCRWQRQSDIYRRPPCAGQRRSSRPLSTAAVARALLVCSYACADGRKEVRGADLTREYYRIEDPAHHDFSACDRERDTGRGELRPELAQRMYGRVVDVRDRLRVEHDPAGRRIGSGNRLAHAVEKVR